MFNTIFKFITHIFESAQKHTAEVKESKMTDAQSKNALSTVANVASIAASIAAFIIPQKKTLTQAQAYDVMSTVTNLASISKSLADIQLPENQKIVANLAKKFM